MNKESYNKIFKKAMEVYGASAQIRVFMEECAELCHALIQRENNMISLKDFMSEVVDVSIMIEQFKFIINQDHCNAYTQIQGSMFDEHNHDWDYYTKTENNILIISELSFSLNQYDRKKITLDQFCIIMAQAENVLTYLMSNPPGTKSHFVSVGMYISLYKSKIKRLQDRLKLSIKGVHVE